jgi:hypothetical protein
MLNVEQMKAHVAAYNNGQIALGEFEDWFYENSLEPSDEHIVDLVDSVESALSAWHFRGMSQKQLRGRLQELANTARPFVPQKRIVWFVYSEGPQQIVTSTASIPEPPASPAGMLPFHPSRAVNASARLFDSSSGRSPSPRELVPQELPQLVHAES